MESVQKKPGQFEKVARISSCDRVLRSLRSGDEWRCFSIDLDALVVDGSSVGGHSERLLEASWMRIWLAGTRSVSRRRDAARFGDR